MEGVDTNVYGEDLNPPPTISADARSADAILFLGTPEKQDRIVHTPFRGFISGIGFRVQANVG